MVLLSLHTTNEACTQQCSCYVVTMATHILRQQEHQLTHSQDEMRGK